MALQVVVEWSSIPHFDETCPPQHHSTGCLRTTQFEALLQANGTMIFQYADVARGTINPWATPSIGWQRSRTPLS